MKRVVVVGGGLAGLSATVALADASCDVTLLEASPRFGGQVATLRRDGFVVEQGAEGFLARSEAVADLSARVGLTDAIVTQATRRTLLWRSGRLVDLPEGEAAGLLGIPIAPEERGRGLKSFAGGMEDLTEALLSKLRDRARLRTGARVSALDRRAGAWHIEEIGGERHLADAVIVAVPPRDAQHLLGPLLGGSVLGEGITYGSTVTVTLAYPREAVTHPLRATGFVVDGDGPDGLRACTFSSSKFPGRAGGGWCLLRAFFDPGPSHLEESDAALATRGHRVLAPILGLAGEPGSCWVQRWPDALPRYSPAHSEAVEHLHARLAKEGPIGCAGGTLTGGGIDGAVRSGMMAASWIVRQF